MKNLLLFLTLFMPLAGFGQYQQDSKTGNSAIISPGYRLSGVRSLTLANAPLTIQLTEPNREGIFRLDATDTTTPDNNGTVLVTAGGKRYKRVLETGEVNAKLVYGAKGDGTTNDFAALQAALNCGENIIIPPGTYNTAGNSLTFTGTNKSIGGYGATIVSSVTTTGQTLLKVLNSTNVTIRGLRITGASKTGTQIGVWFDNNSFCTVDDCYITNVGTGFYSSATGTATINATSVIKNNSIYQCGTGVLLETGGEYYTISGNRVFSNGTGISLKTANINVNGNTIADNAIAIYVLGSSGGAQNTDHSAIVGNTINHNWYVGIHIENTSYSMLITGNNIYAQIGPFGNIDSYAGTGTDLGIYAKNSKNLTITGNTIARNRTNIGYEGLITSVIAGNGFNSDNTRTTSHIREFGTAVNAQNVITSNSFEGALLSSNTTAIEVLSTSVAEIIGGNVGTTFNRITVLTGALPDYLWTGSSETVHLKSDYTGQMSVAPARKQQVVSIVYQPLTAGVTKPVVFLAATLTSLTKLASVSSNTVTLMGAGKFVFTPDGTDSWAITAEIANQLPISPTLVNSWAALSSAISQPGYWLTADGRVQLQGLIMGGAVGSVMFTLPVSYRPQRITFMVVNNSETFGCIQIDPDGSVKAKVVGSGNWLSLDGISFSTN